MVRGRAALVMLAVALVAGAAAAAVGSVDHAAGGSTVAGTELPAPVRPPKHPREVVVTCSTLQPALNRLRAGQTLLLRAGSCPGQFNIVDKELDAPAEIRAFPGDRVLLTGGARTGYPAIFVTRSANVIVGRGLEITNAIGPCVVIESARNVRLLRARIHHCGGQGVLVQTASVDDSTENVQLDRNEIWATGNSSGGFDPATGYWRYGTHAIYFGGGRGVTAGGGLWNNYIHDQPAGHGIQVGGGAEGTIVAANTIRRVTRDPRLDTPPSSPDRAGACVQIFSSYAGSRDVRVVNNVCTDAATRGIHGSCSCAGQGTVWRNVVWRHGVAPAIDPSYGGATLFAVGRNWVIDPLLGDDGRPLRGSPLVGKADQRFVPLVDFDGKIRRSRTIGAFDAVR